ncbi:uncharacterized protein LOC132067084 [Lycium ferocissimum]|uniref:uncharacterized protein LOC132067084 n=1 Tax=Lycium ferocissimum TaxID=112874 RepID=UPI0028169F08|nr:uncharacterized protein LOC132067084 [Lycium ferocissimum]
MGITHLCFADDLLLFARGDESSIRLLHDKFSLFSEASGLKANLAKSQVYFGGVDDNTKATILSILGYEIGELPFKYLGLPLSTKRLTILQCKPLVNKITARITTWMAKCLSYAGRLQFVKAMLFGVQAYWSQLFFMPKKIIKMVEAVCRSYMWSGEATIAKKAIIAWDKVCLPKNAGGMNLLNLRIWNQVAICKLLWALSQKKDRLWITWIYTCYIKNQDIHTMDSPKQAAWMIRKIIHMRKHWQELGNIDSLIIGGKFHLATAYKRLRGAVENVAWNKLICYNIAEPKHNFILWVNLHGKLRTKDMLIKWGLSVDPLCVFCNSTMETQEHLFFDCPFTKGIWQSMLNWQQWDRRIQTWSVEWGRVQTEITWKRPRKVILRASLATVVYSIWIERNKRIFQHKITPRQNMVHQMKLSLCTRVRRNQRLFSYINSL